MDRGSVSFCSPAHLSERSVWFCYLGLLKVQVLADGGQQSAEAFQRLLVMVFEQLYDAVVHDHLSEHFEFEKLPNELNVAKGAPPGFVFGLLQLLSQPLLHLLLAETERSFRMKIRNHDSKDFLFRTKLYPRGSFQFLLLLLKDLIIIFVLLKLLLAPV